MFVALLSMVFGVTSANAGTQPSVSAQANAAGGTICVGVVWPQPPEKVRLAFVVTDTNNRTWRVLTPPLVDGRAEACTGDLPPARYVACEVQGAGFRIVPLPGAGQEATATCVALTLAAGETARAAFRNAPEPPVAAGTAVGAAHLAIPDSRESLAERP
jgi:hypothetical protein